MAQQLAESMRSRMTRCPRHSKNTFRGARAQRGGLLARVSGAFSGVSEANTNPVLQKAKTALAPQLAAHQDAIRLNKKLFERVAAIYRRRASLKLDPESLRLVEREYDQFVHSGARLSDHDKGQLKKLNQEASSLSDAFSQKLLDATKAGAYVTADKTALAALAMRNWPQPHKAANNRNATGYLVPLQNTTQQPVLASLSSRATRETIFGNSGTALSAVTKRYAADHRALGAAKSPACPAAWISKPRCVKLERPDGQKLPKQRFNFMDALVPVATAKAAGEGRAIQELIDAQQRLVCAGPWIGFLWRTSAQSEI